MTKRILLLLLVVVLVFSMAPINKAYASNYEYKETVLDQTWDWFTTLGKQGAAKDRILAENKAERLKRYVDQIVRQAGKDAGNAASDTKKKLGF